MLVGQGRVSFRDVRVASRRVLGRCVCARVCFLQQGDGVPNRVQSRRADQHKLLLKAELLKGTHCGWNSIIHKADRDNYGNIPIYLNSPGGSVAAAFAMVEVMDREEFSAFVSSDADLRISMCFYCLYLRRFHEVIGTGQLGIHSCYAKNTNTGDPEPDRSAIKSLLRIQ